MSQRFSGSRLRAAREAAGLSRERVALDIGRSYESVASYELGRVTPPLEVLGTLAALYGVQTADLLDAEAVPA
jgi:transcriptional regulator with XRE-family HTH domain